MATVGKYCKAYSLKSLRKFNGWTENDKNLRKAKQVIDSEEFDNVTPERKKYY